MRTAPRRTVTALAIAAAIVMTPMLSGCGGVEGIIEQVSGGAIQPSVGELPNEWPAEVPVIDGEILVGNLATDPDNSEASLWNVVISSTGDSESTKAAVDDSLLGAGFEKVEAETAGVDALPYSNANYLVLVFVATDADDKVTATYTVTENIEANQ